MTELKEIMIRKLSLFFIAVVFFLGALVITHWVTAGAWEIIESDVAPSYEQSVPAP